MKITLAAFALFLPLISQAKFETGDRIALEAKLELGDATGIYSSAKKVSLSALTTKGELDFTGFMANIDGEEIEFQVTRILKTDCYSLVNGVSVRNEETKTSSTLTFFDYSNPSPGCGNTFPFDYQWDLVKLTTLDQNTLEVSDIVMRGNPRQ